MSERIQLTPQGASVLAGFALLTPQEQDAVYSLLSKPASNQTTQPTHLFPNYAAFYAPSTTPPPSNPIPAPTAVKPSNAWADRATLNTVKAAPVEKKKEEETPMPPLERVETVVPVCENDECDCAYSLTDTEITNGKPQREIDERALYLFALPREKGESNKSVWDKIAFIARQDNVFHDHLVIPQDKPFTAKMICRDHQAACKAFDNLRAKGYKVNWCYKTASKKKFVNHEQTQSSESIE